MMQTIAAAMLFGCNEFEKETIMKAEIPVCCTQRLARRKPYRLRLAMAFLFSVLAQPALINPCFASGEVNQASNGQWTAALPEEGAPPAPASALAQTPAELSTDASPAETTPPQAASDAPAATEPAATEPAANEPAATEPTTTEPAAAEPADSTGFSSRSDHEVRELSVSPGSQPLLPEGRPAWVGSPPDLSNPRRHRLFVGSYPTSSLDEVESALDKPMVAAVVFYLEEEVLEGHEADDLSITPDFIRRNLLDASTEYLAELNTSTGPAYQKWVVLEITPEHRQHFVDAYRQVEQRKRIVALGLGVMGILSITGVAHLAFNRRRRRYAQLVQPVVHMLPAEPDPVVAKGSNRSLWLLTGGLGCLMALGALLVGGTVVVHQDRAEVDSTSINVYPRHIRSGDDATVSQTPLLPRPPKPPKPPVAAEVYLDPVIVDRRITEEHVSGDGVETVFQVWDESH